MIDELLLLHKTSLSRLEEVVLSNVQKTTRRVKENEEIGTHSKQKNEIDLQKLTLIKQR